MCKKLILLLFFVFIISSDTYADLGLFDVQAVCKITLKNGKTIEGVILVGTGGYQRYYDTNGFYLIINNKVEKAVLFNIDFKAIEPYKGIVHQASGRSSWGNWFKNPKVYYLHDITSNKYYHNQTEIRKEIEATNGNTVSILKRDIIHHIEYELLEYIPIFPEVPKELYLNSKGLSVKPLRINVNEIERFELVREPSQKWIEQISTTEEAWIKAHPDETGETYPPVWFHEILRQKEYYENLFKPWQF